MNIKNNINYFKKSDLLKYIGIGMIVIGGICFFLDFLRFWSYIIPMVFIPTGAVLFIIGSSARSNDNDIELCIERLTDGLDARLENNVKYKRRIFANTHPMIAEGFEYKKGLMFKRAKKDNSLRTSEYTKAVIYVLTDGLHITMRTVSLISDDVINDVYEILYDDIIKLEIKKEQNDFTFNQKVFSAKMTTLLIECKDNFIISIPIHDDMKAIQFVEKTNKIISEYKKSDRA